MKLGGLVNVSFDFHLFCLDIGVGNYVWGMIEGRVINSLRFDFRKIL